MVRILDYQPHKEWCSVAEHYGERRKPVVFNLDKEEDRMLYAWACKQNFSRIVKQSLIAMMRQESVERVTGQMSISIPSGRSV